MKSEFEYQPHKLPPTMARDLARLTDKRPIVSYGPANVDRQQPDYQPAPSPAWHKRTPRE